LGISSLGTTECHGWVGSVAFLVVLIVDGASVVVPRKALKMFLKNCWIGRGRGVLEMAAGPE
jgi:hypothetical protein